jgi:hypothetical protein
MTSRLLGTDVVDPHVSMLQREASLRFRNLAIDALTGLGPAVIYTYLRSVLPAPPNVGGGPNRIAAGIAGLEGSRATVVEQTLRAGLAQSGLQALADSMSDEERRSLSALYEARLRSLSPIEQLHAPLTGGSATAARSRLRLPRIDRSVVPSRSLAAAGSLLIGGGAEPTLQR